MMGAGEVLPKQERAEKGVLVFFFKVSFFFSAFVYLSWPPEFPEHFLVIPTDRKGKIGSVLAFLPLQRKAVEQELLKSVTRDKRPAEFSLLTHSLNSRNTLNQAF